MNRVLLSNLSWFLVSLTLAFFVWLLATVEADPIQEQTFRQIPIQWDELAPNLTITELSPDSVNVIVRAQQSVIGRLTSEDIRVNVDLRGFDPGSYTVELRTRVTRHADADPQPRQVNITLEEILSKTIAITPQIIENPPAGYQYGDPSFGETQATVSGAASRIQKVVAAHARLDLSRQRDTLEADVRLTPVDADGAVVAGVELIPQVVSVTIPVTLREDVRIVSIEPDIDSDSLPDGYDVTSMSYDPKSAMVVGSEEALATLPDVLLTERITLAGHTDDFEISVPIIFDRGDLTLLSDNLVTVSIGISPLETTRLFENIPVTVIGLNQGRFEATLVTDRVTVFVTGLQPVLETLQAEDISAVLDLNGLPPGTHDVELTVTSREGQIESVSHQEITVTITERTPEELNTPSP